MQRLVVGLGVGEWVDVLKSAIERNGYVICDGADAESAIRNAERARDLVQIETEQEPA